MYEMPDIISDDTSLSALINKSCRKIILFLSILVFITPIIVIHTNARTHTINFS